MMESVSGTGPRRSALPWLWLSVVAVVLDLGTKALATAKLTYGVPEPVLSFFNLTLLHNKGAAFSFLSDASGWQRWFFVVLAIVVSVVLIRWLATLSRRQVWLPLSISLILGGAVGNLYDRIVHGYVVDFLHFYWQSYHFPAFNLADSFITVGAVMMAIEMFRNPAPDKEDSSA